VAQADGYEEQDPSQSWPGMEQSTAQGARHIFRRFMLVAVGLNALVGLAVVSFDVADSVWTTHDHLRDLGTLLSRVALRLRSGHDESDQHLMERAADLTGFPMALLSREGRIVHASSPAIARALPLVWRGKPPIGASFAIRSQLGELSGAWVVSPFSPAHDLLVVVTRRPEDEGLVEYMTIAAGLTGLGLALSFGIMLIAANWMLRRPLSRLVEQLTGALAMDVHRRKLAEQRAVSARLEAEAHLAFRENLINASESVGIVATDAEGRIQVWNQAAERILGHPESEVCGKASLDELLARARAALPKKESWPLIHAAEGEEMLADAAGRPHLLELQRSDIRDREGRRRGALITFIDVTERRRLEAELQQNELKLIQSSKLATLGEMATGVAHELNQPLNNIGLLSSRMIRKLGQLPLAAEESEFFSEKLAKVQTQVERAGKIIDHLRTFGRVRERALGSVDARASVDGVLVFLAEQLRQHAIEIVLELPPALPRVTADEAQLEQVLMNLILNARDALDELPEDALAKQITIAGGHEPGWVTLEVRDNGPGMPAEVRERIFDPFFTTKEVGKGTGLGLSISYGLVRDFGGTLEVQSEPRKGATFRIRLREAERGPG
jgi:PAS domain S-box-containing protein